MVLDVKELCRLCGKKEEFYKDLKDEDNKNILKMIQEFIQIPFAEHDELPTKVCLNCEEKIQSFQLFIVECYNVQETLRQMCLESCEKYPIKLEYDVEIDCYNSAIKSEVKHELSDEDLVNANNSDECMTGVDADDYNNDNDDDDNVTLATLKDLKQEKTSERRRMTLTETGMEHLKEISDLNTGDLIECDKRPRITKALSAMNKHKKRHKPKKRNGTRKFCCSSCDKVFTLKSNLIDHVQTHLPIEERKLYSCDLCELKFTTSGSVARHRRVAHDKIKPHVCDECGRAFPSAFHLREHRAVHSDDRPFACRTCDKRFKTRGDLKGHEVTHDDKRRHVCSHCNKGFRRQQTLKEHMYTHTGDKPLACEWCDFRCSYASALWQHRRRHHPDKMAPASPRQRSHDKFKCDVCGYACATASKLREHRATHSDDRPFACRTCDKRFKTRKNLRSHEATHDDKRRYVCSHCDKAFRQRQSLKVHMRSHTGDKPLRCEWCDYRCSYGSVLCYHRRRRHPDKMAPASPRQRDTKDDEGPPKTDVEAI